VERSSHFRLELHGRPRRGVKNRGLTPILQPCP
jgi:hypothetical protein